MSKKVLIITYYWPPIGGSGVQRWLKMSRYLSFYGWEPLIYTPENPSFGVVDESLMKDVPEELEVIRLPIWEPYQIFAGLKGKRGVVSASDIRIKKKKGIFDKLALWLRGNLFIPDPRVFWVRPSIKFLPEIISSNGIDAVITTGPPHSLHLIGKKLKKRTGVKWIADFRDPWTEWDLYEEFSMTALARRLHKKLEKEVLKEADKVITINNYFKNQFEEIGGREVEVVSNGYDEADFENFQRRDSGEFTIRHIGIVDEMRDPAAFLEALKQFLHEHQDEKIKVEFIGNVADTYKENINLHSELNEAVTFKNYQPHEEIIRLYEETDVLLLILTTSKHAAGNTTGKIYEYLASGVRILALGPPDGEVAEILDDCDAGMVANHDQVERIREILEIYFYEYRKGIRHQNKNVQQYSRRAQAGRVSEILNSL